MYIFGMVQGGFFDCSSPISVPKRKSPISQSQPFLLTRFNETAAVIGWLAIFFLVLKLGRNSQKNHPVYIICIICEYQVLAILQLKFKTQPALQCINDLNAGDCNKHAFYSSLSRKWMIANMQMFIFLLGKNPDMQVRHIILFFYKLQKVVENFGTEPGPRGQLQF